MGVRVKEISKELLEYRALHEEDPKLLTAVFLLPLHIFFKAVFGPSLINH